MKRRKSEKAAKGSTGGTEITYNKCHNDDGLVEDRYGSRSTHDTRRSAPVMNNAPVYAVHPANVTAPATTGADPYHNVTDPATSNGYHVTNGAPEMVQATHGTGAGNNVPPIVHP